MSFAHLRLLIFLPAILIPVCASSSLAFCMMYSAYKLNKKGDNIQPCAPFLFLNQSIVSCKVLTVASWLTYRLLKRQVTWSSIHNSLRIFQFFVIRTIKCFSLVSEAEADFFFWNSLAFSMIKGMLLSHSSAFSKPNLYI